MLVRLFSALIKRNQKCSREEERIKWRTRRRGNGHDHVKDNWC